MSPSLLKRCVESAVSAATTINPVGERGISSVVAQSRGKFKASQSDGTEWLLWNA